MKTLEIFKTHSKIVGESCLSVHMNIQYANTLSKAQSCAIFIQK